MAKKKVKDIIAEELEGFLQENGYELYNVEFVKEGKDWFLRVYVDRVLGSLEEFIGIDDCEKVSRYLSDRLDQTDPIEQNYYLEVSSPGMDRELIKKSDYDRFTGRQVEVKLYKAIDGSKKIMGRLEGLSEDIVTIVDEKNYRWELPLDQIAKTNLAVVF